MINPTLAEMATYPFVRLEEARRDLLARGVEVIDFGKGDPNEPTDPMIRQALVDALPERAYRRDQERIAAAKRRPSQFLRKQIRKLGKPPGKEFA